MMVTISLLLAVIFVVLNALDYWLTENLIESGHREANPIVRFAMEKAGRFWFIIKLPACAAVFYVAEFGVWWFNLAACLLYVWVVWHNWKIYRG